MSDLPIVTPMEHGKLKWADYTFAKAGYKIPTHKHDEATCHMTIVLAGSVKVWGPGWEMTLKTGERCIFTPEQEHEIVALEDGTRTMHPSV